MLVGTRLKELRKSKHLSQTALGNKIGVTKISISGYENETRIPSLENIIKLADALETTTDYLLGREIPIINDLSNKYIGSISQKDLELIQEMRHYGNLYCKMQKDVKRFVALMNSRVK